MKEFAKELNGILVEVYYSILGLEEAALQRETGAQISINEMHLLECVDAGGSEGVTNRAIAQALRITPPSATAAVTKLEQKGLVRKQTSAQDGRQIRVVLTPKGEEFTRCHERYHQAMVEKAAANFTEEEQHELVRLIRQLNQFFRESIQGVKNPFPSP